MEVAKMKRFLKIINEFNQDRNRMKSFVAARQQLLSDTTLSTAERRLLIRTNLRVHPNDGMYQGDAHHYLSVGLSAIRCVEAVLEKTNRAKSIESILDLPCGYGRVLRFLRSKFREAKISACEIDPETLDFCRRTFFANPIRSDIDFNKIFLPQKFDLIWCGSLITHLDEIATTHLLRFFYDHLHPNGVCIFTTHGQFSVDSIQNGEITYGLSAEGQNKVITQFDETGYGYADYVDQQGYGISAVSYERMISLTNSVGNWKEIFFRQRGWDNHQDVYGFIVG
jgi:SAM-dependent methyltransferase